jgi:osmotically-inducible protein OsmY
MSVAYPLAIADQATVRVQVNMKLLRHHLTRILHAEVVLHNGVVMLEGKAQNAAEKNLLTQLVTAMCDVKTVKNRMTVAEARVDRLLNPSRPVHGCTGQAVS